MAKKPRQHLKRKQRFRPHDALNCSALLMALLIWVVLSVSFCAFFYKLARVSGASMKPNFHDQDIVVLRKKQTVKRFDVVQCDLGDGRKGLLRVIGLAGDKVEYRNDDLLINDQLVDEKFIIAEINTVEAHGGVYTKDFTNQLIGDAPVVPQDSLLLLGDNRQNTNDSRLYGYISTTQILGVVVRPFFF